MVKKEMELEQKEEVKKSRIEINLIKVSMIYGLAHLIMVLVISARWVVLAV